MRSWPSPRRRLKTVMESATIKNVIPVSWYLFLWRRRKAWQDFVRRRRARNYSGDVVECPICGGHFEGFLPCGDPPRSGRCPACLSVERDRLIYLRLQKVTDVFERRQTILHIAPEVSLHSKLSQVGHRYHTVDLQSPLARERVDVTALPYPEMMFDAIICNHVLEHVPNDEQAMSEFYRILRPGGWALLVVPFCPDAPTYEDWSITDPVARRLAFGQEDHVRVYGNDYADRLRKTGFAVQEDWFVDTLNPEELQRYGLAREVIHFCLKQ
jgi:SAM-dependent methyltransferase